MAAATTIDTYPLIARPENLVPLSILRSVKIEVSQFLCLARNILRTNKKNEKHPILRYSVQRPRSAGRVRKRRRLFSHDASCWPRSRSACLIARGLTSSLRLAPPLAQANSDRRPSGRAASPEECAPRASPEVRLFAPRSGGKRRKPQHSSMQRTAESLLERGSRGGANSGRDRRFETTRLQSRAGSADESGKG
jgi:hypothetical protein